MKKLILLLTQLFCHHKYQYTEINHDGLNTVECKWCGKRKIVKILPLLALAFVMCGCMKQHVLDYGIVRKVEIKEYSFKEGYKTKYVVTVDKFNAEWLAESKVYTNTLYQIGDTIQITKKN